MLKIENTELCGWDAVIRGMRNPMNSWDKSDSVLKAPSSPTGIWLGANDSALMKKLVKAGTDHRKFMRMITVYADIIAPLYWWKEYDTYKVGTVANSCSTMHKIADKEFTVEDFSCEHLITVCNDDPMDALFVNETRYGSDDVLEITIKVLNYYRSRFLATNDKKYWWQMIQLLPSSYNQRRTVLLNYEVLANIYKSRKNHKLDEWSIDFCGWIKTLPYSELITGEEKNAI